MDTITHSLIRLPSPEESIRFEKLRSRLLQGPENRDSIGTYSEKSTHRLLKHFLNGEERFHEIPIGSYVADVFDGERIFEIQSRNFGKLKGKLAVFLDVAPVTVIYPVSADTMIFWIDPETGEVREQRKSGKHGRIGDIFRELGYLRDYLSHPKLSFRVMFFQTGDYRLLNGYGPDKKKHASKFDRIPEAYLGDYVIEGPENYVNLIPGTLPKEFTSRDLGKAAGIPAGEASRACSVLSCVGAIRRIGSRDRFYLYERSFGS